MPFIFQYLVKLSVSLAVVFLFYRFILRPLTFYTWNRWYLLCYSAIAFVIPFVDINPFLAKAAIAKSEMISFIPVIDPRSLQDQSWFNLHNSWNQVLLLFLSGVAVLVVRLLAQLVAYMKLKKFSALLSDNPVKLYQVDKDIVPFSFGNSIFVNQEQHDNNELREIIRHEFIHVKQRHTADMIWAEILCILNWYNPFAWMIKKVIRQNLEFIADQQVLENGLDRKEYQYLLLKVAGGASFRITNQFNFSFLKKRIAMMNKMKSAKLHLLKFAFVLPLIAVLLLSFRDDIENLMITQSEPGVRAVNISGSAGSSEILLSGDTTPDFSGGAQFKADNGQEVFAGESQFSANKDVKINHDTVPIFDPRSANPPMFIVNEIVRTAAYVNELDPADIDHMEVLKGESALQYGDKGKNGVVRIYMKTGSGTVKKLNIEKSDPAKKGQVSGVHITTDSSDGKSVLSFFQDSMIDASQRISVKDGSTIRIRGIVGSREPLYVLDGIVQPGAVGTINHLDPDIIESLTVLKDHNATALYGAHGANGVVLITTKKDKGEIKLRGSIDGKPVIQLQLKGSGQKRPAN